MKPPEGLEDEEGGETIDPQGVHFSTDSALSSAMNNSQLAIIENLITDSNSNSVLEDGFCWYILRSRLMRENPELWLGLFWVSSVWLVEPQVAAFTQKASHNTECGAVLAASPVSRPSAGSPQRGDLFLWYAEIVIY